MEVEQPVLPIKTVVPQSSGRWLTTGEAYKEATARGFGKSQGTFRRALNETIASGTMPSELKKLRLVADLDTRRTANPKDNSVRWLRFER